MTQPDLFTEPCYRCGNKNTEKRGDSLGIEIWGCLDCGCAWWHRKTPRTDLGGQHEGRRQETEGSTLSQVVQSSYPESDR